MYVGLVLTQKDTALVDHGLWPVKAVQALTQARLIQCVGERLYKPTRIMELGLL